MKNLFAILAAVIIVMSCFVISGCSGADLEVDQKLTTAYKTDSITVVDKTELTKHKNYLKKFAKTLEKELYDSNYFKKGGRLILEYKVTHLNPGSQTLRYFIGFGSGTGEIFVQAAFLDASGRVLSKIHATSSISMGFFGGDFSDCIDTAAEEIVEYAKANFLGRSISINK